jgi:hypothetical protein
VAWAKATADIITQAARALFANEIEQKRGRWRGRRLSAHPRRCRAFRRGSFIIWFADLNGTRIPGNNRLWLIRRPPEMRAIAIVAENPAHGPAVDVALDAVLPGIDLEGQQRFARLEGPAHSYAAEEFMQ